MEEEFSLSVSAVRSFIKKLEEPIVEALLRRRCTDFSDYHRLFGQLEAMRRLIVEFDMWIASLNEYEDKD